LLKCCGVKVGLRDFVRKAVKNTPQKNSGAQSITKIIGNDEKIMPVANVSWENCKYLKKTANHCLCTQFSVFCAKEKCHRKYMKQ